MALLITLIIGILVFCLLWWAISLIPFPPPPFPQFIRPILWIILILVAVVWLLHLGHFV